MRDEVDHGGAVVDDGVDEEDGGDGGGWGWGEVFGRDVLGGFRVQKGCEGEGLTDSQSHGFAASHHRHDQGAGFVFEAVAMGGFVLDVGDRVCFHAEEVWQGEIFCGEVPSDVAVCLA